MFDFIDKKVISLRSKFRQVMLRTNNIYLTDMYLTTDKKQEIFKQYGESEMDTGSAEGQIALFSYRITHLTDHLKKNKKDYNTQRALVKLVGKRRRLLDYLKDKDIDRYREIIKALKLRK
jgi:small subunit ribosomal protein S15